MTTGWIANGPEVAICSGSADCPKNSIIDMGC